MFGSDCKVCEAKDLTIQLLQKEIDFLRSLTSSKHISSAPSITQDEYAAAMEVDRMLSGNYDLESAVSPESIDKLLTGTELDTTESL